MENLVIISAVILCTYTFISIVNFGIPKSLSETYYLYKYNMSFGMFFQICFGLSIATLLPMWIEMSQGSIFQFLGFLTPISLMFVTVTTKFKERFEGKIHSVLAIFGVVCLLLWVILVAKAYIALVIAVLPFTLLGIITQSLRKNLVFWLEMISFVSTYLAMTMYLIK